MEPFLVRGSIIGILGHNLPTFRAELRSGRAHIIPIRASLRRPESSGWHFRSIRASEYWKRDEGGT